MLEVGEGGIEVKSTNGDTHLGGDNIDQRIVDWLIEEFKKDEGLDLKAKGNEMALQRVEEAEGRGRARKDRVGDGEGDGDHPAVHHRGRERAEASGEEADAREAGVAG